MTTADAASPARPLPLGVYVEDDGSDEPTLLLHRPDRPDAPLALLCRHEAERSGARALWTFLAETFPSRDDVLIECPVCDGAGETTVCADDGTHGCSHQHDREYRCAACTGGVVKLTDTEHPDWCQTCGLSGHCTACAA
jgi:hypothetical protein